MERIRSISVGEINPLKSLRPAGVGLDIDRGALKAVQLSHSGGEYALRHVGYRRLPPGVVAEGELMDHDLLASELRSLWESHDFKGKSVQLGLSNQQVVVRLLEMPRMSPEDLRGALGFEAQEHIPMPLEDALMDHLVIGPSPSAADMDRILIVAANREMVLRYTSAVRSAGLRPVGVDVKALSLVRSTLPEGMFSDEGAVVLLDVGSELTNLAVVERGAPMMARFIPGGSAQFSDSAARASRLSPEDSEGIIMDQGFAIGRAAEEDSGEDEGEIDPALIYDMRRSVEDAVRALADEIQRSIEYYQSQSSYTEISRMIVSGEGALIRGFTDYLGELLGSYTDRANPISRLVANRSNITDEQLRLMEPVLAVAIGLAMEAG